MPAEEPEDDIDRVIGFWKEENPQLDCTTKAVAMRLRRASQHLERVVRSNLADSGVDEYWEIEVLLTLRRAPDHRANAGELGRECQVTSGAITNRISRLEKRGWVRRDVDPDDRRQVLVSLTTAGLAQADHIIAMKTQAERWAFDGVDRELLERVARDLRMLVLAFERQSGQVDDATALSS
ncbi:MAG: MarR family winged helix-turn-helix transcriptional regulator [Acidimicrobiales bacterium]